MKNDRNKNNPGGALASSRAVPENAEIYIMVRREKSFLSSSWHQDQLNALFYIRNTRYFYFLFFIFISEDQKASNERKAYETMNPMFLNSTTSFYSFICFVFLPFWPAAISDYCWQIVRRINSTRVITNFYFPL